MTAIVRREGDHPMPISTDTIRDIVGDVPVSPADAAERDVRDILERFESLFEANLSTLVEGIQR